jgi:hypothetical protein
LRGPRLKERGDEVVAALDHHVKHLDTSKSEVQTLAKTEQVTADDLNLAQAAFEDPYRQALLEGGARGGMAAERFMPVHPTSAVGTVLLKGRHPQTIGIGDVRLIITGLAADSDVWLWETTKWRTNASRRRASAACCY